MKAIWHRPILLQNRMQPGMQKNINRNGLKGGHNHSCSIPEIPNILSNESAGASALSVYPGGMQIGGGITAENAEEYLDAGASHVIVTSYIFREERWIAAV